MQLGEANLFGEHGPLARINDTIYTPDWVAADMVSYFQPKGKILEPCRGDHAFTRHIPNALWCEIKEGRDFFAWSEPVDWIMTNPPYSLMREFMRHAFSIAKNVVFLLPAHNIFRAYGAVREPKGWGGLASLRWYGAGSRLGFPMGNPVAAFHWLRGHQGIINETFYEDESQ